MDRIGRMMAGLLSSPPEVLRSSLWPQQQCYDAFCPDLEAKPFHDRARFPWLDALEAAFPQIRAELDAMLDERAQFEKVSKGKHDENVAGTWGSFNLYIHGRGVTENLERCPATKKAVDAIPDRIGLASFMALAPDSHVLPHYGTTNLKLRIHLGLRIPDGAAMRISDQIRPWQEGKAMVLDDSFQHEVWNAGKSTRYILLVDFLHPDFTPAEKERVRRFELSQQEQAWRGYAHDERSVLWAPEK